jgi:acyl-CoA oxidase
LEGTLRVRFVRKAATLVQADPGIKGSTPQRHPLMTDSPETAISWPEDRPELTPFIPFVIDAWSDDTVSPGERGILLETADGMAWLAGDGREALGRWLDPDAPPSPTDLKRLRARVRSTSFSDTEAAARSLTDLGLALWESTSEPGPWTDQEAEHALRALEISLGCLGAESARAILGQAPPRAATPRPPAEASFDGARLCKFLDRDRPELRARVAELLADPALAIPAGLPTPDYRERVLAALERLAAEGLGALGYPEAYGGAADPAGAVAVFETLAFGDLSVVVKFGVHFGLFGGSVYQLGTRRHHEAWLEGIGSLAVPGCYAMTERAHGSNVRDLETTATYDPDTDELVVHTPHSTGGWRRSSRASWSGTRTTECTPSWSLCATPAAGSCPASTSRTAAPRRG